MKRYFLFLFFCFVGSLLLVAQVDTLILPFSATALTEEQKESNPDYLAYPLMLQGAMPEMVCNVDCMDPVDLGLSVMWASCNVGADKPEAYGDYFAWGEIASKKTYYWSTYKHSTGSSTGMIKYCTKGSYGVVDNKMTLESADDAAAMLWGENWRMPTDAEVEELRTKCTWTWTKRIGVSGYEVTGENGNSIFLPAAGYMSENELCYPGVYGSYWTTSLYDFYPNYAYRFYLQPSSVMIERYSRFCGFTIRAVYDVAGK